MFKTSDSKTAQNFKKKEGYIVIQKCLGLWLIFLPKEIIPKEIQKIKQENKPKRKYTRRKETVKKYLKRKRKYNKRR